MLAVLLLSDILHMESVPVCTTGGVQIVSNCLLFKK